jgi:hypothetical protein
MAIKSNPDETLDEIIATLDIEERRYVFARALTTNDKEAYEEIGVSYNWLKGHDKDKLNGIAAELVKDVGFQIMQLIKSHGVKAAKEIIKELDDRDVHVRSSAATQIIDRIIGKPTQSVDQKTEQSGELKVKVEYVNTPYPTSELSPSTSGDSPEAE